MITGTCNEQEHQYYIFIKEDDENLTLGEVLEGWSNQLFLTDKLYPELLSKYNVSYVLGILFDDNKIDKVVCDNQYKFLIPDKKYSLKNMNNKFARMECKH